MSKGIEATYLAPKESESARTQGQILRLKKLLQNLVSKEIHGQNNSESMIDVSLNSTQFNDFSGDKRPNGSPSLRAGTSISNDSLHINNVMQNNARLLNKNSSFSSTATSDVQMPDYPVFPGQKMEPRQVAMNMFSSEVSYISSGTMDTRSHDSSVILPYAPNGITPSTQGPSTPRIPFARTSHVLNNANNPGLFKVNNDISISNNNNNNNSHRINAGHGDPNDTPPVNQIPLMSYSPSSPYGLTSVPVNADYTSNRSPSHVASSNTDKSSHNNPAKKHSSGYMERRGVQGSSAYKSPSDNGTFRNSRAFLNEKSRSNASGWPVDESRDLGFDEALPSSIGHHPRPPTVAPRPFAGGRGEELAAPLALPITRTSGGKDWGGLPPSRKGPIPTPVPTPAAAAERESRRPLAEVKEEEEMSENSQRRRSTTDGERQERSTSAPRLSGSHRISQSHSGPEDDKGKVALAAIYATSGLGGDLDELEEKLKRTFQTPPASGAVASNAAAASNAAVASNVSTPNQPPPPNVGHPFWPYPLPTPNSNSSEPLLRQINGTPNLNTNGNTKGPLVDAPHHYHAPNTPSNTSYYTSHPSSPFPSSYHQFNGHNISNSSVGNHQPATHPTFQPLNGALGHISLFTPPMAYLSESKSDPSPLASAAIHAWTMAGLEGFGGLGGGEREGEGRRSEGKGVGGGGSKGSGRYEVDEKDEQKEGMLVISNQDSNGKHDNVWSHGIDDIRNSRGFSNPIHPLKHDLHQIPSLLHPHSAALYGSRPVKATQAELAAEARHSRAESTAAAAEKAAKEAQDLELDRLRSWVQDLRTERKRLEDLLLSYGDNGSPPSSAVRFQSTRDDLENQVSNLTFKRDKLRSETQQLNQTRTANLNLLHHVEALQLALAAEIDRTNQYGEVREQLTVALTAVRQQLDDVTTRQRTALEALIQERDVSVAKMRRAVRRCTELDSDLAVAAGEVQRLERELQLYEIAQAELRTSGEVLQAASEQLQQQLAEQTREASERMAAREEQLACAREEIQTLNQQHARSLDERAHLNGQIEELGKQIEDLVEEKSQLNEALDEQHAVVASTAKKLEQLQAQQVEEAAAAVARDRDLAMRVAALRQEHKLETLQIERTYETRVAAADKQYAMLNEQYESGLQSIARLSESLQTLRKERDELWSMCEQLRRDGELARRDREDAVAAAATTVREAENTNEILIRKHEVQLAAVHGKSEELVQNIQAEAEKKLAALQTDLDARYVELKEAAAASQRQLEVERRKAEQANQTVAHLRTQIQKYLIQRENLERELRSERGFTGEVSRVLDCLREAGAIPNASSPALPSHKDDGDMMGLRRRKSVGKETKQLSQGVGRGTNIQDEKDDISNSDGDSTRDESFNNCGSNQTDEKLQKNKGDKTCKSSYVASSKADPIPLGSFRRSLNSKDQKPVRPCSALSKEDASNRRSDEKKSCAEREGMLKEERVREEGSYSGSYSCVSDSDFDSRTHNIDLEEGEDETVSEFEGEGGEVRTVQA